MSMSFGYTIKEYKTAKYLFDVVTVTPLFLESVIKQSDKLYRVKEFAHNLSPGGYQQSETQVYVTEIEV